MEFLRLVRRERRADAKSQGAVDLVYLHGGSLRFTGRQFTLSHGAYKLKMRLWTTHELVLGTEKELLPSGDSVSSVSSINTTLERSGRPILRSCPISGHPLAVCVSDHTSVQIPDEQGSQSLYTRTVCRYSRSCHCSIAVYTSFL